MKKNTVMKWMVVITICLIIIDQVSKVVVKRNYENPVENGVVGIRLVENTGMAFGLNSGNTKNIVLTVFVLLIILNFVKNQKDRMDQKTAVAISLVLSGGISNLIDRVVRGGIVDFLEIKNFAIFNIADCYIVVGWILLIIFLIKFSKETVGEKKCEKP